MEQVFGAPRKADRAVEPVSPIAAGGPYRGPSRFRLGPPFYRYEHATFFFERGRIVGAMITEAGASTGRHVAVGERLDEARATYPELRCGRAPSGDRGSYAACAGRLAPRRYIWFGGDPIENITIGIRRLGDV